MQLIRGYYNFFLFYFFLFLDGIFSFLQECPPEVLPWVHILHSTFFTVQTKWNNRWENVISLEYLQWTMTGPLPMGASCRASSTSWTSSRRGGALSGVFWSGHEVYQYCLRLRSSSSHCKSHTRHFRTYGNQHTLIGHECSATYRIKTLLPFMQKFACKLVGFKMCPPNINIIKNRTTSSLPLKQTVSFCNPNTYFIWPHCASHCTCTVLQLYR